MAWTHEDNLKALEEVCNRATHAASMYRHYMHGKWNAPGNSEYDMTQEQITAQKQAFAANRTALIAAINSVKEPDPE